MERYENSFLWLKNAGVALPCYNVTEPTVPLRVNEKHNLFKLFYQIQVYSARSVWRMFSLKF